VLNRFPFKAVLFDVDGTLVDSNSAHAEAWTRALLEHGVETDSLQIRSLIGMGADKLLPAVARVDEESSLGQSVVRRKKAIFNEMLVGLQPTPGARPLLQYLRDRDVTVVIATSADEREMHALLDRAGVSDLIAERTSKDDASQSKPDPEIVHAALARSGADREDVVLVGDTPYDIEAAHRAGIRAIAVRCGGFWSDAQLRGALEVLDHPAALLARWQERTAHVANAGGSS
jgi:HAD superfamily hydrolase (TIGR01509 family)